jgi:hypothetical protein
MSAEDFKTAEIDAADLAFAKLVNSQMARVTLEILKLEQMLKAGMVDPAVLKEFRKAVDEIRRTSWNVEQSLQAKVPNA